MTVYTFDTFTRSLLIDGKPPESFEDILGAARAAAEITAEAGWTAADRRIEHLMGGGAFDALTDQVAHPAEHRRLMAVCREINRDHPEVPAG